MGTETAGAGHGILGKPCDSMDPDVLYEELIRRIQRYHPSDDTSLIRRAYLTAKNAHMDQRRKSGEPYVIHPVCVAIILADLELDKETIIAGLLHDVVEDTILNKEQLARVFGQDVAQLVDGVTKLTQVNWTTDKLDIQAENLRKMFLAMAKDIRVILIKLADRLHNMRTLQYMKPEKQKEKAKETLEIYGPIADRLGISKIKVELDDLALRYLEPEIYQDLVRKVAERSETSVAFIDGIVDEVQEIIDAADIRGTVNGRQKHYFSIYKKMVNQGKSFEQIYDLLGEEKISSTDYLELLQAGFEEIRLGTLPQETDRVLVGDIERTRVAQCRVLFFTGVNDGNIPRGTSRGGLLSDLDREFLKSYGAELSPTPRQQMYLQRLYLYMNMTKPTDSLYLSFARTTPEGGTLHPSYLIQMIRKLFPEVSLEHPQLRPCSEQLAGEADSVVWISGALRDYAQGKLSQDSDEARAVKTTFGYLMRNGEPRTRKALDDLKEAAFMRYDPVMISRETAQALYGNNVMGGISRMETAAKCSLRQFLQYGLKLSEREEYRIEPVDTGTILHRSLDAFSKKLKARGLSWSEFSKEEGAGMISEALMETAADYHDLLLYSTKRSESSLGRMERILARSADTLQYQIRKGSFVPEEYEFSFGPGADADMITFSLSGGRQLKLVGRIDRLDLCREDGSIFVKILDYKSGSLDLDEDLMKRGIQLQLLMYMNAAMEHLAACNPGKKIVPSAMLYYKITDPVIDGAETAAEEGAEAALKEIRAELRPTGMVNSDPVSLKLLGAGGTGKSDVIPVTLKKDGTPTAASHVYSQGEFEQLTREVEEVVCRLAEDILDGKAEASPAMWKDDKTACDYCPYRGVCGFDPSIEGYKYRK